MTDCRIRWRIARDYWYHFCGQNENCFVQQLPFFLSAYDFLAFGRTSQQLNSECCTDLVQVCKVSPGIINNTFGFHQFNINYFLLYSPLRRSSRASAARSGSPRSDPSPYPRLLVNIKFRSLPINYHISGLR